MTEHSEYADRNTDLFFDIADILEFFPEQYRQGTWGEFAPSQVDYDNFEAQFGYDTQTQFAGEDANWIYADEGCGSALCIAGHAAALSGWFPTITGTHRNHPEVSWTVVHKKPHQTSSEPGHKYTSDAGREALGINDAEAAWMFDSERNWTPDDLRRFAAGVNILPDHRQ